MTHFISVFVHHLYWLCGLALWVQKNKTTKVQNPEHPCYNTNTHVQKLATPLAISALTLMFVLTPHCISVGALGGENWLLVNPKTSLLVHIHTWASSLELARCMCLCNILVLPRELSKATSKVHTGCYLHTSHFYWEGDHVRLVLLPKHGIRKCYLRFLLA